MEAKKKKVLIALDYDISARKIAKEGYTLAQNINASTILLHVVLKYSNYSSLSHNKITGFAGSKEVIESEAEIQNEPQQFAQIFLKKIKSNLGNETIQILVKEGDFAQSIIKAAIELNVDLIVMGLHSKRWLEKVLMGSVTEKVLNQTNVPLFIIPTKNNSSKNTSL